MVPRWHPWVQNPRTAAHHRQGHRWEAPSLRPVGLLRGSSPNGDGISGHKHNCVFIMVMAIVPFIMSGYGYCHSPLQPAWLGWDCLHHGNQAGTGLTALVMASAIQQSTTAILSPSVRIFSPQNAQLRNRSPERHSECSRPRLVEGSAVERSPGLREIDVVAGAPPGTQEHSRM